MHIQNSPVALSTNRIPIPHLIARTALFLTFSIYLATYFFYYVATHGDGEIASVPLIFPVSGTVLLFVAAIELVYSVQSGYYLAFKSRDSYFLFLLACAMTAALQWDQAFNKAFVFDLAASAIAFWIYFEDPLFRNSSAAYDSGSEDLPTPLQTFHVNKRKLRRKNKGKRK